MTNLINFNGQFLPSNMRKALVSYHLHSYVVLCDITDKIQDSPISNKKHQIKWSLITVFIWP